MPYIYATGIARIREGMAHVHIEATDFDGGFNVTVGVPDGPDEVVLERVAERLELFFKQGVEAIERDGLQISRTLNNPGFQTQVGEPRSGR